MPLPENWREWQAVVALWAGNWEPAREMTRDGGIVAQLEEIIQGSYPSPNRCVIVMDVYVWYALKFGSLDDLKPVWRDAVAYLSNHYPEAVSELKGYWNRRMRYEYGDIDPRDFGFTGETASLDTPSE